MIIKTVKWILLASQGDNETLKRNNAEMERNPATAAANSFSYYKDPINYVSPTPTYTDLYPAAYPFEDDIKEKRYQYQAPTAAPTYQHQQVQSAQQQHHVQQPQSLPNIQYHQSYPTKTDYHQQSYKTIDKGQPMINPYTNYTYPNYKDNGQYPTTGAYYDQYKFNVGLGGAPAANYGKTAKDTNYHQNFSPGMYADGKLGTVAYCEEANHSTKASMVKPTSSGQVSQYPMYSNCYGYPTATAFPNQNYCSYAQSCNDDARALWDEYQTNRRLMPQYVSTASVAPPASVQTPTGPPQANCRLKANYSADYYGSNAAYHAYHSAEGMRSREKLMYQVNSHVPTDNLYGSRTRCLPVDYKYHQTVPQNVMMTAYDPRYNYVGNEAQTFDYCAQRQDTGGVYHHPAYGKAGIVPVPPQKHIRTAAALPNEYCNSQQYYVCSEQIGAAEYQDMYSQQCMRPDARHTMAYNIGMMPANRSIIPSNDMLAKEKLYAQSLQSLEGAYYTHANVVNMNNQAMAQNHVSGDKSKVSLAKGQNLREFLATWNEDEDDGIEKMEENDNQLYLQQTNIEVENGTTENHLQFKGSFNTRPKIHVGITVDSNVANNQYINLPDIIIDIEKPKDTDLISHSIEATQNGSTEKLVVLESIDIPVDDLSQYTSLNLLESSIDGLSTTLQAPVVPTTIPVEAGHCMVLEPSTDEVVDELMKEVINVPPDELSENSHKTEEKVFKKSTSSSTLKAPREALKCNSKEKRRKRIMKTKSTDRNRIKCRTLVRMITTRSGKIIRIRKVKKRTKKRRNMLLKKASRNDPSLEHSKEKPKRTHSSNNPKTLKDICIGYFNSPLGREMLLCGYNSKEDQEKNENLDGELINHQSKASSTSSSIPKLSALCEYALNSFYEEKNTLLLNLDDIDSNLYFIECDINENIVRTADENGVIELYVDDEMEGDMTNDETTNCVNDSAIETTTNTSTATSTDTNHSFDNCSKDSSSTNDHKIILDNSLSEICLTSDENSRDFSALHHEEIVPDNLHAFENEKLIKYLQHKYIQKSNYLKVFVIDKICKKYRKYVLKRRNNEKHHKKNEMTKKILVSTLKEKFIKQSKQLKMDSSS